jgi:polyhydroxyalkanoate synthesis regulator phasin
MLELIRKSILAGIGAVILTKEKIGELTRTLVEEGKISTSEAEKLADELVKSGEHEWEEINTKIHDSIKKWADSIDMVRRKEFQEMKARIDVLEQRLTALEGTEKEGTESEEKD